MDNDQATPVEGTEEETAALAEEAAPEAQATEEAAPEAPAAEEAAE